MNFDEFFKFTKSNFAVFKITTLAFVKLLDIPKVRCTEHFGSCHRPQLTTPPSYPISKPITVA